jgi:hypothetical protein
LKKIVSISLLFIYLLSLAGNTLFIEFLVIQNQEEQVTKIDNGNFERAHLIEIKIPLRLPYYSSSIKYERYYGEVTIQGHNYNYVQRKVLNDTVYLLCLPDFDKNTLEAAKLQLNAGLDDEINNSKKGTEPVGKKHASANEFDQFLFTINIVASIPGSKAVANILDEELMNAYTQPPLKPPSLNNNYYKIQKMKSC